MKVDTRLTHSLSFDLERDDAWPESVPWPEYKTNTDKTYHPERARTSIGWQDGERIREPTITIYGRRHLKNGDLGSEVRSTYYYASAAETPDWVRNIAIECVRIANEHAARLRTVW